jgi:hypothetical protein
MVLYSRQREKPTFGFFQKLTSSFSTKLLEDFAREFGVGKN